jgi:hypothetical protein
MAYYSPSGSYPSNVSIVRIGPAAAYPPRTPTTSRFNISSGV